MLKSFSIEYISKSANIFYDIFTNPPWSYTWLTLEKTCEYFMNLLNEPASKTYAYFENENLIGACFGNVSSYSPMPIYEIKEIFVTSNMQNKGLGTKMLSLIEQDLKQAGITTITLYTVRGIPAFDFYKKNGYETIDTSVNMSKILI